MSVHKRGNKWVFRKRVKMPDGTIKNIQRTFDTKKEAQLQEQLFKFENQHENSLKDLTIDQCFLLYKEVKSDEHNDNKVKRYTMYDYSRLYNRNISTYFGKDIHRV